MTYKQPWKLEYETANINDGFDIDILEGVAIFDSPVKCNYRQSIEDLVDLGISLYGSDFLTNVDLMRGFFGVQLPDIIMYDLGVKGLEKQSVIFAEKQ